MTMYFKASEDMSTAASCPFIPKLPLTVPKLAVKSAEKDPGTMDFALCEDSKGLVQVLNLPVFNDHVFQGFRRNEHSRILPIYSKIAPHSA